MMMSAIVCAVCGTTPVAAQQTDAAPEAGAEREIGLDFSPFVRGQAGLSLLYKHGIGLEKVALWKKRSALRLLAGFHTENNDTEAPLYKIGDTTFIHSSTGRLQHYFFAMGIENQLTKGDKFRFYYGGDLGMRSTLHKPETRIDAIVNGATLPYDSYQGKVTTRSIELYVFGGVAYFFKPWLSVGLELYYSLGIEFSNSKIIRNGQAVSGNEQTTFVGSAEFPRLLYLSYHF